MLVPVLTAVSDAVWEAQLVAALSRGDLGVAVVRRCVDLADLLATAATGQARAVLLSADLRRLDREALTRLAVAGVAVVGLVPPGDEDPERRLRQLGVSHVLPSDASAEAISAAVVEAVVALTPTPSDLSGLADPRSALPRPPQPVEELEALPGTGRLVAVWGPTGAPGRTTVAVGIAAELAALGWPALLVDADVYGGVVAQVLGLLDESPGLAAACRQANNGQLDVAALAGLAREVAPALRVLTGIARADRWPELRPSALDVVLTLARSLAAVTVVDCGFALEQDEELVYDTMAPRRNGATVAVLEQADTVVVVGTADPVGLQRLVRGLSELKETVPGLAPTVVVNRLRASAIPGDTETEVRAALQRYAGIEQLWVVPQDTEAVDAALAVGRTLAEAAPGSPARQAIQRIAAALIGVPAPARRGRLLRR
ncbi:MAG: ATPase involved in chromosome partitioning [Frankiales bacterium]|nr:ATPase involved in chromosome partitioning [Frankiales bacterium]